MSLPACTQAHALLAFNQQVLEQALLLVRLHEAPGRPVYAGLAGDHLRHLIEHFEALVCPARPGVVDYDSRARDRALATVPHIAVQRLLALQRGLQAWSSLDLGRPVRLNGLCGTDGSAGFSVESTLGRELAFVASHAVHHFALLGDYCRQHLLPLPQDFGKAPATVAHERGQVGSAQVTHKELTCTSPLTLSA